MPAVSFHHGARVFQSGADAVLIPLGDSSVVGLLGTAPDAVTSAWPLDVPILITNPTDAASLGDAGTIKDALDTIFDQGATNVVVVRIEEGADTAALLTNALGDFATLTGIHAFKKALSAGLPKPKLLLAPGISTTSPPDGIASVAVTNAGSGYDQGTTLTIAGTTGSGAEIAPIIGSGGTIDGVVIVKPGFGYTGALAVTVSGAGAGAGALFSGTIGPVMNALTAEAIGVAEKLKAFFYADGPDGTDQQAVTARKLIGSRNVFFCDPRALKSVDGVNVPAPSSPIFVGQQAAADRQRGVHWTGSNRVINGIVGTNRAVMYGDQANYLNENRVNTIINKGDGFRTWGVWTCSSESVWQFVNVVRTTYAVNEAIEKAFMEFVDRPMTKANLDFMIWSGLQALKNFENDGALLPGSRFALADGNTPTTGAAGIVKLLMAFEVPAPMADIRITAHRNIEVGYTLLFNSVTGEVEIG